MRIVVYDSAQVQRRSDYHHRDLVLGVYSEVGYAGTFPEAIDANNFLVTKLCCIAVDTQDQIHIHDSQVVAARHCPGESRKVLFVLSCLVPDSFVV